jgi:hypothetical protein
MEELVSGLPTKAEKIRTLDRAGAPRAEIARFLGVRYQHVRNVLVRSGAAGPADKPPTPREIDLDSAPRSVWLRPDSSGRVELPETFRAQSGIGDQEPVLARLQDGEIVLMSRRTALARAQALVREFVPEGVSLVDKLLAERRAEAERERDGG